MLAEPFPRRARLLRIYENRLAARAVINLMDALRQSLSKKAAGSTSKRRSARAKRNRKVA
jgi:non-homologous end joining protein Ku